MTETKDPTPPPFSTPPPLIRMWSDVSLWSLADAWRVWWGVKWSDVKASRCSQTRGVIVRQRFNLVQNEAKSVENCFWRQFEAEVAWRWLRWYICIHLYGFSHLVSCTGDLWAGFHTSAFLIVWMCIKSVLNRRTTRKKRQIIRAAAKLLLRLATHLDTVWLSQINKRWHLEKNHKRSFIFSQTSSRLRWSRAVTFSRRRRTFQRPSVWDEAAPSGQRTHCRWR